MYLRAQSIPWHRPGLTTALSGLAQSTVTTVSDGQFGRAVSHTAVPAAAARLLRLSARFRQMAGALDGAYVDHRRWTDLQAANSTLRLGQDGIIQGNRADLQGRRVLYVGHDDAGSLFIRASAADNPVGWDIIRLTTALGPSDTIEWAATVAHESAHAEARVTGQGGGGTSKAQRVQAAILDEMNARTVERRVLAQICATTQGRALRQCPVPAPPVRCEAERDWFPSLQLRTYLEQFCLGIVRDDAARKQGLGSTDVEKIDQQVRTIDLSKSAPGKPHSLLIELLRGTPVSSFTGRFPVLKTDFGRAAFVLHVVDGSWRDLKQRVEKTDRWPIARESRLQRHARLFFDPKITYTKCP